VRVTLFGDLDRRVSEPFRQVVESVAFFAIQHLIDDAVTERMGTRVFGTTTLRPSVVNGRISAACAAPT
jgi:hypothetical protein